jgi:hypothetical protein
MHLVVTVDTEEDNWGKYHLSKYSTENIENIIRFQDLCIKYEIKPTYLLTYQVAYQEKSVRILREIAENDLCEIGTHPHPWNTPPYDETRSEENSMLCNLPPDLQYKKIESLHETIIKNFDLFPLSFRGGRWAFNEGVAKIICQMGYKVDTSIIPFFNWAPHYGIDFSRAFPSPYRFSVDNIFKLSSNGELLEVPASVGFNRVNFEMCCRVFNTVTEKPFTYLKIEGILRRLKLLKRITLSPEDTDDGGMIELAKVMLKRNQKILNMFFHSPSLMRGHTPFIKTKSDEKEILRRIESFFLFARESGLKSIKLSDATE